MLEEYLNFNSTYSVYICLNFYFAATLRAKQEPGNRNFCCWIVNVFFCETFFYTFSYIVYSYLVVWVYFWGILLRYTFGVHFWDTLLGVCFGGILLVYICILFLRLHSAYRRGFIAQSHRPLLFQMSNFSSLNIFSCILP